MLFKGTYRLTDPGEVEATLSITMSLNRWERLKKQLNTDLPSLDLSRLITRLLDHGNRHFHEKIDDPEKDSR